MKMKSYSKSKGISIGAMAEEIKDIYSRIKEKIYKREWIEDKIRDVKNMVEELSVSKDESTRIDIGRNFTCYVRTEWLRKRLDEYIKEEYDRSQHIRDEINMINKGD